MGLRCMRKSFLVLLAVAALTLSSAVPAKDWGRYRRSQPLLSEMTLDTAVDRVRERTGARIISADTVQEEGRRVHEVRILTDQGKVRRYRIDEDSGEPLGPRGRSEYSSGGRQVRPSNGRSGDSAPPQRRPRRP